MNSIEFYRNYLDQLPSSEEYKGSTSELVARSNDLFSRLVDVNIGISSNGDTAEQLKTDLILTNLGLLALQMVRLPETATEQDFEDNLQNLIVEILKGLNTATSHIDYDFLRKLDFIEKRVRDLTTSSDLGITDLPLHGFSRYVRYYVRAKEKLYELAEEGFFDNEDPLILLDEFY
jgi:hypothetical protein